MCGNVAGAPSNPTGHSEILMIAQPFCFPDWSLGRTDSVSDITPSFSLKELQKTSFLTDFEILNGNVTSSKN
jgi:hypothetical protein